MGFAFFRIGERVAGLVGMVVVSGQFRPVSIGVAVLMGEMSPLVS